MTPFFRTVRASSVQKLTPRNSGATYESVPIMTANMDTTGTYERIQMFCLAWLICVHSQTLQVYIVSVQGARM